MLSSFCIRHYLIPMYVNLNPYLRRGDATAPFTSLFARIYVQELLLPHAWLVVRILSRIGSVVVISSPLQEQSPSITGVLMTSTALPSSRRTARKASWIRKSFPWINPRERSLLRVVLTVLGPTWSTIKWTQSYVSTIQIQKPTSTS